MEIFIRDSGEFHRLLFGLVDELVEAAMHHKLYQDLLAAIPEYSTVFSQSPAFWSLTLQAHRDAVLTRICKAYDQYGSGNPSLNLQNLLDTIQANLHLFDEPNFRQRLKENAFVDSLSATPRRPDLVRLQQDKESVSASDPLVAKLIIWRNNFYAHRSPTQALAPETFATKYPLSTEDVEQLLSNGLDIVNRYSDLFIATQHSTKLVGQDDYLWLLKAVRESIDAEEARIQQEIKHLTE
jgi:hypothetical protein